MCEVEGRSVEDPPPPDEVPPLERKPATLLSSRLMRWSCSRSLGEIVEVDFFGAAAGVGADVRGAGGATERGAVGAG